MWWIINTPKGQVAACVPPKCGLTSFQIARVPGLAEVVARLGDVDAGKAAIAYSQGIGDGPFEPQTIAKHFPNLPRLIAARNPEDRFISLWRHITDLSLKDHPVFSQTAGMSPDALMGFIESYPMGNEHWWPQWAFRVPNCQMIRFTEFNQTLGLESVHANSHAHRGNPDLTNIWDRLRKHYARDFEMWEAM